MDLSLERLKEWKERQAMAAYRTRKERTYIFSWMMIASAVRIAFFRYETFWPSILSTIIALLIGDFIGSRTYERFVRLVRRIQRSQN